MRTYKVILVGIVFLFTHFSTLHADPGLAEEKIRMVGESWTHTSDSPKRIRLKRSYSYNYGDPTPAEQAHLEAINRARMNPQAEADRLLSGDLNEGISPPALSTDPRQPLTFNSKLYEAARLHSEDMVANNYFDHMSLDNRTPGDRILATGYQYLTVAENIAVQLSTSPLDDVTTFLEMHDDFVVNSGTPGRTHRQNIFNGNLKEIGVGTADGPFYGYPYSWLLTQCFGSSSQNTNSFVLGVVYDDSNSDERYTAGEGAANVTVIAIEQGGPNQYQTATASAGGYGIQLPSADYLAQAELADGKRAEKSVSVVGENVKVDFLLSEFAEVFSCGLAGDVDGSGAVELADAIVALRIISGIPEDQICMESDVNADEKIGAEESIYVLQIVSALR